MVVEQFEVYLVDLEPTLGSEIRKTRPCLVISPDEMNRVLRTVIIAPMTTQYKNYPTRVACRFEGKDAWVVLDQIRTVDYMRLLKRLGNVDTRTRRSVLEVLTRMFLPNP